MLHSLFIANFRLFRELRIKRLGRVNLITGKNGSGKSCLLDALYIYYGRADPRILLELIDRQNDLSNLIHPSPIHTVEDKTLPLHTLFKDGKLPSGPHESIQIGNFTDHDRLRIYLADDAKKEEGTNPSLVCDINGIVQILAPAPLPAPSNTLWPTSMAMTRIQYIRPGGLNHAQINHLWDRIQLTTREEWVIEALNILYPKITRLAFIGPNGEHQHRMAIVTLNQIRTSLSTLGSGINRLLPIILAMVNADAGVVLLDEMENGLHWTVHYQLWRILFHLANQLDIQLFATTHSKDCILGFHDAWKETPNAGAFFRLDPDPEAGAQAIHYSLKGLSHALETQTEMR
ncbi:MAG: AAA family ATPase [Magnetococcales bacterium]|nr:AAA family ATPase [Magnetococcales bacterium]NGZ06717.1 AAA family ATPase [Magnetococcales bacterium]